MLSLRKSGMIEVQGYDKAWIVSEQLISNHEMFVEGFLLKFNRARIYIFLLSILSILTFCIPSSWNIA